MIKIDVLRVKDTKKRLLMGFGVLSVLLSIYTVVFVIIAKIAKRSKLFIRFFRIFCILFIFFWCWWAHYSRYTAWDFIEPYTRYGQTFLILNDPIRWIITSAYTLFYSFNSDLLGESMSDWIKQEKIKEQKRLLPVGKYNYACREHELVYGSTGAGKGVLLNHVIRYCCQEGIKMIIIEGKPARTDRFSQLAYCRRMAKEFGLKLYVASMDETIPDRCQYNPYQHMNKKGLINSLRYTIKTDSNYYLNNFLIWVGVIYDALKACSATISMNNILDLYDYEDYEDFLISKKEAGILDEETFQKLTSKKNRNYAKIAENDSANIQRITEACDSVFLPTPNKRKFTITDAIRENAIIFFDLNGLEQADATKILGCSIIAEIQHVAATYCDDNILKTAVFDEAAFYMGRQHAALFSQVRSAGWKVILSTQGPGDLSDPDQQENARQLLSQLSNNCNAFSVSRLNSSEDAQIAADLIGTVTSNESTHRADSLDYSPLSSNKAVEVYAANPNIIKNLPKKVSIFYEKKNNDNFFPEPVLVKWRTDDL